MSPPEPLPIDEHLPQVRMLVERHRALVIVAAPGAGKTTRVPPALLSAGPAIVLQPRRAAARSIAARIATEQRWTLGQEVGWHVRFERNCSAQTRLTVATEGILTARLQSDPLLSDFATIILDEFHERSVHADVAIALSKQALLARPDLRLVVMSATIDAARVSAYLGGCPVLEVTGHPHPLRLEYHPNTATVDAVGTALKSTAGNILCFEPGAAEISRTVAVLHAALPRGVQILPLHGGLSSGAQDEALSYGDRQRVIVATNIAETSVTVPGVTWVVDTGLEKVARFDHQRAIDSLSLERVSTASAEQRAGRAARIGPGTAWRLWDQRDHLSPYRAPDIHRIDLTGVALDLLAWGGDPSNFDWFEAPREGDLQEALELLERLGATAAGRLTATGRDLARLPLPPRIARVALAGRGSTRVLQAAALLAEGGPIPLNGQTTNCDLLTALDAWHQVPERTRRVYHQIQRALSAPEPDRGGDVGAGTDELLRSAILAGYPDRVAKRRDRHSPRFLMTSGTGAVLSGESGVREAEFIVALDLRAPASGPATESRIRVASAIERDWLKPTAETVEHALEAGVVRARRVTRYGAIRLADHPALVDYAVAASLVAEAWLLQPRSESESQLLRRLAFAHADVDEHDLVRTASIGARSLADIRLVDALSREQRLALERHAPEELRVPSGRNIPLDYQADGTVLASVKLQELFGLADTPRLGPRREPVLLALLAPNGRPVQLTRDLKSFWERTYPEVRRELRGRYPKHPWPEDPWTAQPTHRAKPRAGT